jgi:signal transduction histidine kinase
MPPYQVYSTFEDITDRKKIEQDRKTMESQLRQAQKLEAVGRLAGGVAHDFNNMLSVIMGNVELALQSVPPTHPAFQALNEIAHAARRSASLTQQLLAFARKQTVAPQMLDLNETVQGTLQMLERLIGENIELTWKPEAGLPAVKIDRGQLDQVLTNLVVNARDAIEGAGSIVVATRSTVLSPEYCQQHHGFKPGTYVILSVQDTGCGMEDKILENLFEPFFTTKPEGSGTGLGLSTVHGILQQNQGLVKVSSTAFRPTLPRAQVPLYVRLHC